MILETISLVRDSVTSVARKSTGTISISFLAWLDSSLWTDSATGKLIERDKDKH